MSFNQILKRILKNYIKKKTYRIKKYILDLIKQRAGSGSSRAECKKAAHCCGLGQIASQKLPAQTRTMRACGLIFYIIYT